MSELIVSDMERRLTPRDDRVAELSVTWRFENRTDGPIYVLLTQPLSIRLAPLFIDHASNGGRWDSRPHVIPSFEIQRVDAHFDWQVTYKLPLPAPESGWHGSARFGYSATPHDPSWVPRKNWKQVEQWQETLEVPLAVGPP